MIDICRSAGVAFEKLEFSLLESGISGNCSKKVKIVWICDTGEAIEYEVLCWMLLVCVQY